MNPTRASYASIGESAGEYRTVHDTRANRYYRLGLREAAFLEQLDGSIGREDLMNSNPLGFSKQQVEAMLSWFEEHALLEGHVAIAPSLTAIQRVWDFLSHPDRWRIVLFNPDSFLDRHRAFVEFLFGRPMYGIYAALLCVPGLIAAVNPPDLKRLLSSFQMPHALNGWVVLYASFWAAGVLHELGHAIACKHYGGKVPKIGIMFLYLQPLLYCDVTDSWRFRENGQRMVVSIAGIFVQVILSALAFTVWLLTANPFWALFAAGNLSICVFNLFPFVRLDGYWLLAHYLDKPNLQKDAMRALTRSIRQLMRRADARVLREDSLVVAFGVGHILALPLFWGLGYWGLLQFAGKLPWFLGWVLLGALSVALCFRAVSSTYRFITTLFSKGDPQGGRVAL